MAAVKSAHAGDTVYVCTGVYNEQVMISQAITLAGQSGATIQPQNAVINATDDFGQAIAIVYVNAPGNVTVSGFIVDGSLANANAGCSPDFLGIYYSGTGGTIAQNAVRFIEQEPALFGCQTGLAIYADNALGTKVSLAITGNSVHDFQKNGITVLDDGYTATITGNTILGVGPTAAIGQNGIQVGPGGTGTVSGNNASGFVYSPCTNTSTCPASATGVLVVDTTGVTISGNTLGQSQGAIYVYADDPSTNTSATISKNIVSDTLVYDGIGAGSEGNTISGNTVTNSGESGIALYASGNTVTNNNVIEAPVGVALYAAGNPAPTNNKDLDVVVPIQNPAPTSSIHPTHVQPFHAR